jgi:hypothetical protein
MPERYRKGKISGVQVSWDDGETWESHTGPVPEKEERTGIRPSRGEAAPAAAESPPFVDEPPAQPSPAVPPTPEVVAEPEAVPGEPNVFARAYDWVKQDLAKGLGTGVPPEVRGVALGSTFGVAPKIAPQIVGGIQEAMEFMHPVDEPGLPPREFGGGRSTDPDRPIGTTLGGSIAESEAREYQESIADEPIRTGVGYLAGQGPAALYAGLRMAPVAGEGALQSLGRAVIGSGAFSGAQAAHTGDPVEVAEHMAIGAAFPLALEGGGRTLGLAEDALREGASRFRLSAATGQLPYGRWIRRLVKEKGVPKMVRMGEVVEETGMAGAGPVAYKTTYMRNAPEVAESAGEQIAQIHGSMGGRGARVDLGPTIKRLRDGAKKVRADSMGDPDAIAIAQQMETRADNYATRTVSRGKTPLTTAKAEHKADAILTRATREQNDAIEAGRQLETPEAEIMNQVDEIWSAAQTRADEVMAMVDRPFETSYVDAHNLRQYVDSQAWSPRTGDAMQKQHADMFRDIGRTLRRSIGDAIEEEAPQFAKPLRAANEQYEAAMWVKMHGDAGSSSRTSTLAAVGAGGIAHGVGGEGIPTAVATFATAEAARRYAPGMLAAAQRYGARAAAGAPGFTAAGGRMAGVAAGTTAGFEGVETPDFEPGPAPPPAFPPPPIEGQPQQPPQQPQESPDPGAFGQQGPQSDPEVQRVLQLLEADPEAFGEQSGAVKAAAEAGNIRAMRFTIANAMRRQREQQSIGAE